MEDPITDIDAINSSTFVQIYMIMKIRRDDDTQATQL